MTEPITTQGGPDTIAARNLIPGVTLADYDKAAAERVVRVLATHLDAQSDRVVVMLLRVAAGQVVLERYPLDQLLTLATPEQVEAATVEGQRERLADALEDLVRDIRHLRLTLPECARRMVALLPDGLTYDRADGPAEQTRATCEAGTACTGRDGKPSALICERCGHCSIHDRDAGCAARTDTGRCGCTGGGAS